MTRTLIGYATRLLLLQFAVMLLSFTALLQLLDLLNNTDKLFERHGEGADVLFRYIWLRLPDLASFLFPFAVLLAALLVLGRLAQSAEVMAMKAAGLSYWRILAAFFPAAAVIAGLHFIMADQVAPIAAREMADWNAAAEDEFARSDQAQPVVWARDGLTLARVVAVLNRGRALSGVTLFMRNADNVFQERVVAKLARYRDGGWDLYDVARTVIDDRGGTDVSRVAQWRWASSLSPQHFSDLAATPASLSLRELHAFAANENVGSRPTYYYETWFNKRLALPVMTLIMVLLAAPVAQSLQRQHGVGLGFAAGIGMGFLYFIADGILQSLGESGMLPPQLAAWSPVVLFASIGATSLIRIEGY
ncbi:MAG: LPS export ABC transporter permease LptG [Pseudomonadota bacterium]